MAALQSDIFDNDVSTHFVGYRREADTSAVTLLHVDHI